jgi:hypothetical protein
MKKVLAIVGVSDDIAAVRHDLPHMPSLGVSSLDSRPPWRHGGLLFVATLRGHGPRRTDLSVLTGPGLFAPPILYPLSRQTDDTAADALLLN